MVTRIVVVGKGSAEVDLDGVRNPTIADALSMNGGGEALGKSGMTFNEAVDEDYGSLAKVGSLTLNGNPAQEDDPVPTNATICFVRDVKGGIA